MDDTVIKCYLSVDGVNLVRQWWKSQETTIRTDLLTLLDWLQLPRLQWPTGWCKSLEDRPESQCAGLEEIILDGKRGNGRKYYCRIIGFWGPGASDFTMLHAFEKSGDPSYETPCNEAQERRGTVQQDWSRADECDFLET